MATMGANTVDSKSPRDPIAVIGMACRLPGNSNSPHDLWTFLEQGGCAAKGAPKSRFNFKNHFDGSRKPNTLRSPGAMFLENIDLQEFDAPFFSISTKEAIAMDPQQRQLLEVVYECLENAGVSLRALNGAPVGCFVASSTSDYRDIHARDPEDRPPNATVGLVPAILSNRISHYLNIKGPSMTIDTACSASLVSLDVACKYMQSGEINSAIVAGCHLYLSPEANMDAGAMREAFSPSGRCHTFDAKADGYMKAEGINAVLLKRLDEAIKDGDPIRAVIRGSATNSDGRTPGIANPSAEAQAAAIRAAYANAGITDMTGTSYLECHGTGTQAGDPVELEAASSILCNMREEKPLIIGSIKGNIGHSECSAGISGLIKAILAMEKGIIPGNPTYITPNPKIDFQSLKVRASRVSQPWPKVAIRRASVNSFGFGGSNAHVILEEPKQWTKVAHVSSYRDFDELDDFFTEENEMENTKPHLLVFSANDENSLQSYVEALKKHVMYPAVKVKLQDLAYTLSERRTRHFCRGFLLTNKTTFDSATLRSGKKSAETPNIGFVFTGQGAQWSQMGKMLVENSPMAVRLLQYLDTVLQQSSNPPDWCLIDELVQPRSSDHLRQPILSQPLVTALQIVIVEIFKTWGIHPKAVVGHSSGEIAAAYSAGYLSMENAIKTAFYRGQASIEIKPTKQSRQGMLAVGLGSQEALKHIEDVQNPVVVACYNSPKSVTLSGCSPDLELVKTRLEDQGHFARLLRVDLAYHSKYMKDISDVYKSLLDQDFQAQPYFKSQVKMFSSALGKELDGETTDSKYWQKNMNSPVLFDEALQQMVSGREGVNFLIEIGPSGALAGPISEIKANLPQQGSHIQYCTALQRGKEDINSLYEVAGRLFIAGAEPNLPMINDCGDEKPSVIIDLPNYNWNHSNKYWHESQASKDWRYRLFPHHDLIGSKVLGTSYHAPVWKKAFKVDDISWLKDHKLGSDIVVPGAAMIVMAVEAMTQLSQALHLLENKPLPEQPCYRVRNATFSRALVLEEGKERNVMIALAPRAGSKDWHEFNIHSLVEDSWIEHSKGLVRVEQDRQIRASENVMSPLVNSTPGALWYQAMEDVGYALGPAFQKHLEAESLSGTRTSRSIVSLEEPPSTFAQSRYQMHPTSVDTILQACAPALWNGNRTNINAVIIPAIIDDVVISSQPETATTGVVVVSSSYSGIGDETNTKNYTADVSVYDSKSGILLFELSKLRTDILHTHDMSFADPTFCRLSWKPDITFLSTDIETRWFDSKFEDPGLAAVNDVINLVAFKKPNLKILEAINYQNDSSSLWLDENGSGVRLTYELYKFITTDATSLLEAQEKYALQHSIEFGVGDITSASHENFLTETKFDLVIARLNLHSSSEMLEKTISNCYSILVEGGRVLIVTNQEKAINGHITNGTFVSVVDSEISGQLNEANLKSIRKIPISDSSNLNSAFLAVKETIPSSRTSSSIIHLLLFSPITTLQKKIITGLERIGWQLVQYQYPFDQFEFDGTILIMHDLGDPLLSDISDEQWTTLQKLANSQNKILWVTQGSQFEVTRPENAMIHGLMRTIRDEDPSVNFTTLDIEHRDGKNTIPAIGTMLESLQASTFQKIADYEFAERQGIIYISRIVPDEAVNKFSNAERYGAELVTRPLHETSSLLRLNCERVGNLDSLHFTEIVDTGISLQENEVEIEIFATGVNFKDIAISTGLIPGNERLLGYEGAGTIRRSGSSLYKPDQRVLFIKPGSFANRIVVEIELVHPIPDSMAFEEAATLGAVYPVALYSLFDLANTHSGQRVLIHSAAGGLGIACIQICQYIGAEVYATVGNDEKRNYLINTFGVPSSRIFNSRSTLFAAQLMATTNNEGVDVIINSLTGKLLEESWHCLREGGTMVELGKKDILERNYLPMEPFSRNVSFRSFDISHKSVPNSVLARLLDQMFKLVNDDHIKPIQPMTLFPFEDISSAFRYMQLGKHMGKIVISNGDQAEVNLPIRSALRKMKLRDDVAYLIVGGLKGLCGSMALSFARHGARHLVIMGRSGFDDKTSQTVIQNVQAEGCKIHLVKGDATIEKDVRTAFKIAPVPIAGIVQGAMVVRGRLYQAMTSEDFHVAVACKTIGTWNLHRVSLEEAPPLDFFSLLSSTSGVAGQSGQANYVAANAFLDAFAIYRRSQGLQANSIALGPMWDVGYMSRNKETLPKTNTSTFTTITEALFHKILEYSILQQVNVINEQSASHLITGMAIPLKESSTLRTDARFSPLFGSAAAGAHGLGNKTGISKELQVFNMLLQTQTDNSEQLLNALVDLIGQQLMTSLRLTDPIEPARPLDNYGMESLAAVELRNWVRMELQADVTMLEILNATSLISLCEKILTKIQSSGKK